MNMKKLIVCFIMLTLGGLYVNAQSVTFVASCKDVVQEGERFRVTFTLNANGSGFKGPSFNGFSVLSGPSSSTSSSISFVNGRTTQNIESSYSYIVAPSSEGTYTIDAATVTVDGTQYRTKPLTVKVVKGGSGSSSSQQAASRGGSSQSSGQQSSSANVSNEDVFLKVFINNSSPKVGEQVVLTYKIYTRVPLANIQLGGGATYAGFWSQDLMKQTSGLKQQTEYINGQEYVTADLRKVALFPIKSGKIVIDPLEVDLVAQIRSTKKQQNRFNDPFFDSFFNDSFFNTGIEEVKKKIKSNQVTVNVLPLPEIGKPVSFDGAVGRFDFDCTVDKTECDANDAITLKVTVSGKGNLPMVEMPKFNFPPDFEVYDPKIDQKLNTTSGGITGTKTFEYLIIPRKAGDFVLKPIEFSYFNLETNKYVIESTPEFKFKINKGSGNASTVAYSGVAQEDIKYIGEDIRHIMKTPFSLMSFGNVYFGTAWFYLMMVLPLIALIIIVIVWKEEIKKRSDIAFMKNKKANKVAVKRLKRAKLLLKEQKTEPFYIEISQALWGYVSDKFNIPLSSLSVDTVNEALVKKGVKDELVKEFIDVLHECEFARFAPGNANENMERMYMSAQDIITKIEG